MERLLRVEDVMDIVQVSRRTAYTYMQSMLHMERPLRVTEAALKEWIAERTKAPAGMRPERKTWHRAETITRIPRRKGGQTA